MTYSVHLKKITVQTPLLFTFDDEMKPKLISGLYTKNQSIVPHNPIFCLTFHCCSFVKILLFYTTLIRNRRLCTYFYNKCTSGDNENSPFCCSCKFVTLSKDSFFNKRRNQATNEENFCTCMCVLGYTIFDEKKTKKMDTESLNH